MMVSAGTSVRRIALHRIVLLLVAFPFLTGAGVGEGVGAFLWGEGSMQFGMAGATVGERPT